MPRFVRTTGFAVILAMPVGLIGCADLFANPCFGEATWTEPGFSAWLADNGTASGFEGGPPESLPAGPRITAALPDGAVLGYVWFFPDGDARVRRSVQATPSGLDLGAYRSGDVRFTPPSAQDMLEVLDAFLDAVHDGDASSREELRSEVSRSWPPGWQPDEDFELHLSTGGPWDFDVVFPEGGRFESEEGVFDAFLEAGPWTLVASTTAWHHRWEDRDGDHRHTLSADGKDHVGLKWTDLEDGDEVKQLVRSTFPDREWRFEGFAYDSGCIPGPS